MYIYESENPLSQDALRQKRDALRAALPELDFEKDGYMIINHITGYQQWESEENVRVLVFPNCNVAAVSDLAGPDTADRLKALGYHVPGRRIHIRVPPLYDDEFYTVSEPDRSVTANEVLWEELKAGYGHDAIRKNLASLLSPIVSIPNVKEYEFAVYQHQYATSEDAIGYNECKNPFRLPPHAIVDHLMSVLPSIDPQDVLAISSRVLTDEGERHIPMIDFGDRCLDPSAMLRDIGVPERVLVYSGKSFHHYDVSRLLTQPEFESYMSLLAGNPDVGKVWPGLQLEQGFALLRITASAGKPFYPEILESE